MQTAELSTPTCRYTWPTPAVISSLRAIVNPGHSQMANDSSSRRNSIPNSSDSGCGLEQFASAGWHHPCWSYVGAGSKQQDTPKWPFISALQSLPVPCMQQLSSCWSNGEALSEMQHSSPSLTFLEFLSLRPHASRVPALEKSQHPSPHSVGWLFCPSFVILAWQQPCTQLLSLVHVASSNLGMALGLQQQPCFCSVWHWLSRLWQWRLHPSSLAAWSLLTTTCPGALAQENAMLKAEKHSIWALYKISKTKKTQCFCRICSTSASKAVTHHSQDALGPVLLLTPRPLQVCPQMCYLCSNDPPCWVLLISNS